ncbi:MAG: sensor histidine kinase [Chloroflexi bacterium]|nr:sensor histidine kinase [Chloroflexota bacterium]
MDQILFFIFFFYGLAFVGLGIAMLLESGRSPALAEARLLRPLAVFGLIHGVHEWLEAYLIQAVSLGVEMPAWLPWGRLVMLVASFIPLFIYAILALLQSSPRNPRIGILHISGFGLYAGLLLLSAWQAYGDGPIPWLTLLDNLSRYLMAFPAAMLAALALNAQSRSVRQAGRHTLSDAFRLTAIAFGIYAISQLFVGRSEMFPASVMNKDSFIAIAGFPVQVVRAAMAAAISFGLVRGAQVVEQERKVQFQAMQQARLEALEQRDALRRDLLRHTVKAQEDERARIARELHDETAQMLSAISLDLASLNTVLPGRLEAQGLIDRLQGTCKEMSKGIYSLVHELRPAQLDVLGLSSALSVWTERDCCSKGLKVTMRVDGEERRLEPDIETVFFRVMQEALANVTRHAGVMEAELVLQYLPDQVIMQVSDAGRGFDPAVEYSPPRGWGLAGMRERAEAAGGKLRVRSAPGQGTSIEVVIPIPPIEKGV